MRRGRARVARRSPRAGQAESGSAARSTSAVGKRVDRRGVVESTSSAARESATVRPPAASARTRQVTGSSESWATAPDGSLARCPESSTASASTAASPASPARRAASGARPRSRSPRPAATSSTSTGAIPPRRARRSRRSAAAARSSSSTSRRRTPPPASARSRPPPLPSAASTSSSTRPACRARHGARGQRRGRAARPARRPRSACWRSRARPGRVFVAQGSGAIVNVASLLASRAACSSRRYAIAKHGVLGLTRALANEWAPHGVRVNAHRARLHRDRLQPAPARRSRALPGDARPHPGGPLGRARRPRRRLRLPLLARQRLHDRARW